MLQNVISATFVTGVSQVLKLNISVFFYKDRRPSSYQFHMTSGCPLTETVFGVGLEEHLRETGSEISSVIEECCSVIMQLGPKRDGLLYASGNANRVKVRHFFFACTRLYKL